MTLEKENQFFKIVSNFKNTDKIVLNYKKSLLLNASVLQKDIFDKEYFDLIVTSPPYNVNIKYNLYNDNLIYEEYLKFSKTWIKNCFNWTKSTGRFCINIPAFINCGKQQRNVFYDIINISKKVGWKFKFMIIWNKRNIKNIVTKGTWLSSSAPIVMLPVELILVFYKEKWSRNKDSKVSDITKKEFISYTNGLWEFNGENAKMKRLHHPAPFPFELPYRCIKLFSFVDDIVFDPFSGSGTSLIVSNNTNRYSVGLEIDPKYCELSKKRILSRTSMLF